MVSTAVERIGIVRQIIVLAPIHYAVVVEVVAVHKIVWFNRVHEEGLGVVGDLVLVDIDLQNPVSILVQSGENPVPNAVAEVAGQVVNGGLSRLALRVHASGVLQTDVEWVERIPVLPAVLPVVAIVVVIHQRVVQNLVSAFRPHGQSGGVRRWQAKHFEANCEAVHLVQPLEEKSPAGAALMLAGTGEATVPDVFDQLARQGRPLPFPEKIAAVLDLGGGKAVFKTHPAQVGPIPDIARRARDIVPVGPDAIGHAGPAVGRRHVNTIVASHLGAKAQALGRGWNFPAIDQQIGAAHFEGKLRCCNGQPLLEKEAAFPAPVVEPGIEDAVARNALRGPRTVAAQMGDVVRVGQMRDAPNIRLDWERSAIDKNFHGQHLDAAVILGRIVAENHVVGRSLGQIRGKGAARRAPALHAVAQMQIDVRTTDGEHIAQTAFPAAAK